MTKNNWRTPIITILLCLLPTVAGVISYNHLPDQMPIHFTFHNQPDLYGPKTFALFGIPLIMAVVQIVLLFLFITATKHMAKRPKLFSAITWFIPSLTIFLYTIILIFALGHPINIGRYILLALGLFFCILGNYLPKTSYSQMKNYMHPTPKDEKSFRTITKITSYLLLTVGITFLILAWVV